MSSATATLTHRWRLNYSEETTNASTLSQPGRTSEARAVIEKFSDPPGFPKDISVNDPTDLLKLPNINKPEEKHTALTREALTTSYKTSWSIAFSPVRSLFTTAFAIYMTGSTVHFFSIASTVAVLFMHLRSLLQIRESFQPILSSEVRKYATIIPQLIIYFMLCSVGVAMGLYKAHILGFLPTTESDWVALLPPRKLENAFLIHGVAF